jgi:hypothetical protein
MLSSDLLGILSDIRIVMVSTFLQWYESFSINIKKVHF